MPLGRPPPSPTRAAAPTAPAAGAGRRRANAARIRSPIGSPADSAGFFVAAELVASPVVAAAAAAAGFAVPGFAAPALTAVLDADVFAPDAALLRCALRAFAVSARYCSRRTPPMTSTATVVQNIHGNSEIIGNSTSVRIWLVLRGLGRENQRYSGIAVAMMSGGCTIAVNSARLRTASTATTAPTDIASTPAFAPANSPDARAPAAVKTSMVRTAPHHGRPGTVASTERSSTGTWERDGWNFDTGEPYRLRL